MGLDITGLGAVSDLVTTVVNKIWPDKTEQERAELAGAIMLVQGQLDINKVEAANPKVFVSGWRPFIGWVCGSACAWNWIGISLVKTIAAFMQYPVILERADLTEMMPVLLGLLGLGTLRTWEKIKDVAAK